MKNYPNKLRVGLDSLGPVITLGDKVLCFQCADTPSASFTAKVDLKKLNMLNEILPEGIIFLGKTISGKKCEVAVVACSKHANSLFTLHKLLKKNNLSIRLLNKV